MLALNDIAIGAVVGQGVGDLREDTSGEINAVIQSPKLGEEN